ncbi:GCN5 N-acetyltransferase [Xylariaceae sp. FL0255]|nr:GCN5 N-acetyltransferase [Xylariaceae sp. FL0255]
MTTESVNHRLQPSTPTRHSPLTLRTIDENNWWAVASLKIPEHQAGNLASNPMSMVESHYAEDAWVRAIYADEDTPVGFLMMAIWPPTDGYYIWRLMIDEKYQGLGLGKIAVGLAIAHVKENYPEAKTLGVMSTPQEGSDKVLPEHSPYHFYTKLGFKQIAPPDEDGEVLLSIDL